MDEDVRSHLDDLPAEHAGTVTALRELVLDVAPDAAETLKWGKPAYVVDGTDCLSIVTHTNHVNLQFFQGTALDDPDGLLDGTGKSMRHVSVSSPEEVARPELRALVEGAVRHAAGG